MSITSQISIQTPTPLSKSCTLSSSDLANISGEMLSLLIFRSVLWYKTAGYVQEFFFGNPLAHRTERQPAFDDRIGHIGGDRIEDHEQQLALPSAEYPMKRDHALQSGYPLGPGDVIAHALHRVVDGVLLPGGGIEGVVYFGGAAGPEMLDKLKKAVVHEGALEVGCRRCAGAKLGVVVRDRDVKKGALGSAAEKHLCLSPSQPHPSKVRPTPETFEGPVAPRGIQIRRIYRQKGGKDRRKRDLLNDDSGSLNEQWDPIISEVPLPRKFWPHSAPPRPALCWNTATRLVVVRTSVTWRKQVAECQAEMRELDAGSDNDGTDGEDEDLPPGVPMSPQNSAPARHRAPRSGFPTTLASLFESLYLELLAPEHSEEEPDAGAQEGSGDDYEAAGPALFGNNP
ncbi:hypothetical protein DFH09DRAFT_1415106 [Mycena vulgaris]|nr:hypothetical protein DFH09DRAFT_1415106 [Mycena vulgaris]